MPERKIRIAAVLSNCCYCGINDVMNHRDNQVAAKQTFGFYGS